jgi:hypothetical protein
MANYYKLTCVEKYSHFHVKAQGGTNNKTLTNNSLHSHSHGRGRGKGYGRHRENDRSKSKGDKQGKGNRKGREKIQSNVNQSRGRGNRQKHNHAEKQSHDGEKSKEKTQPTKFKGELTYCDIYRHVSRDCKKKVAEEEKKQTTTNSSQQRNTDDDLDVLFHDTLYVHSDDDASDDETMGEQADYGYAYNRKQETNNDDKVFTAQTIDAPG